MRKKLLILGAAFMMTTALSFSAEPLRLSVSGLTHSHLGVLMNSLPRQDIEIVGLYDPDYDFALSVAKRYKLPETMVYRTPEEMITQARPEAVADFGPINTHIRTVEAAAPHGVHVMVEKPLATTVKDAKRMAHLARQNNIHLLTNYETTWYPTHERAYEMVLNEDLIGPIRKTIIYDGHSGPGQMNKRFIEWLTDPVKNGGGAVTDFGCYGANLMTWLLKGEKPLKVYAEVRNHQPDKYPKVDDDATIVLSYRDTEAVLFPSWGWPFSRKDMHIYGEKGYVYVDTKTDLRYRTQAVPDKIETLTLPSRKAPYDEPFRFFRAVVKKEITLPPYDLSALDNNLIVVEILEASIQSARSGKSVPLR